MMQVLAPQSYERRDGVLQSIGNRVAPLGRRALLVGGRTALGLVRPAIEASLSRGGIAVVIRIAEGRPTATAVAELADEIAHGRFDVVIGAGGGRALDLAKAAAVAAGRPVITVPTVPATCAAWAALSVIYDDAGRQVEARYLPYGPSHVLVEPSILAAAPPRFLAAGIADTVVKWWETAPNLDAAGPLELRLQAHLGRFTLDTIDDAMRRHDGLAALAADAPAWADVVDAVILLAGFVGSIRAEVNWGGFAHPFYVAATRLPDTHRVLHGAIVGYGLLVQWALEGRPDDEIAFYASWLGSLGLPVTLAALGIVGDTGQRVATLAREAAAAAAGSVFGGHASSAIEDAILRIDRIGRSLPARRAA